MNSLPFLDAAQKEGLVITWIATDYSSYEQTEIAEYQAANDPSRPLNSLSESEIDFELVRIAKAIDRILEADEAQPAEKIEARASAETPTLPPS